MTLTQKLYYNDYNLNVNTKATVVNAMVKDLLERACPSGIGMQDIIALMSPSLR